MGNRFLAGFASGCLAVGFLLGSKITDSGLARSPTGTEIEASEQGPEPTLLWRFETSGDELQSRITVDRAGDIYFGSDDHHVYKLSTRGVVRWSFDAGAPVRSTPAIGPDGFIYFGASNGMVYALNPADASPKSGWPFQAGVVESDVEVGPDGVVYVGSSDSNLYAINPDGTLKWVTLHEGDHESSPTLWNNRMLFVPEYNAVRAYLLP